MKHVAIMPLIGGLAIGAARALGSPPEVIIDLTDEKGNVFGGAHSSSLRRWWPNVPYIITSKNGELGGQKEDLTGVDITHSVPPCGGLSMQNESPRRGPDAPQNAWMFRTAELAMAVVKPRVHIMENAIAMGTPRGRPVLERLDALASDFGYSVTVVKVDTANHGIPQRRRRTFTMFWRDGARAVGLKVRGRPPDLKIFLADSCRDSDPLSCIYIPYVEFKDCALIRYAVKAWGRGFRKVGKPHGRNAILQMVVNEGLLGDLQGWLEGQPREDPRSGMCLPGRRLTAAENAGFWHRVLPKVRAKVERGLGFRRDASVILRETSATATEYSLHWWIHPTEDRFLNVREVAALMGLPGGFRLDPKGGGRPCHIIQNVPTNTAEDMVRAVAAALESEDRWDGALNTPFGQCDPLTVQDFSRLPWLKK